MSGLDKAGRNQSQIDAQDADRLQQTRLDGNRPPLRHGQVQHRCHYGNCSYNNSKQDRSQRPPIRGLPLRGRAMPQAARQRRMRSQMDDDLLGDRIEFDEREMQDHRDGSSGPFGHVDNRMAPAVSARQGDSGGSGQREGAPTNFRYEVGRKREQPAVGPRLMGMNLPGAAALFGAVAPGAGPAPLYDTLGSLQQLMFTAIRSGTGLAANAASLTRVAITSALAVMKARGASAVSSYTMGDTRSLSCASVASTWDAYRLPRDAAESAQDWTALTPLLSFNTQKPRTRAAHATAVSIQEMRLRTDL